MSLEMAKGKESDEGDEAVEAQQSSRRGSGELSRKESDGDRMENEERPLPKDDEDDDPPPPEDDEQESQEEQERPRGAAGKAMDTVEKADKLKEILAAGGLGS